MSIEITSFYRFTPLSPDRVEELRVNLGEWAREFEMRGLFLLGVEGVNFTVSAAKVEQLSGFKSRVVEFLGLSDAVFKDSRASKHPFNRFSVKVKDEIVTLGKPDLVPETAQNFHMSPAEWNEAMNDPDVVVLDTRNDYEIEIGKFKGAVDFKLAEFGEFPERLQTSGIDKGKKILMYCTGGIRCEKAILEAHKQGFTNVHQLDGGILNYLKEHPHEKFEGDCFVFDHRVAVDQELQPTKSYSMCPHCGQAAAEKIECAHCLIDAVICHHCQGKGHKTCSKNCTYHLERGSICRNPHKKASRPETADAT